MAITQKTLVQMAVTAECPTHARASARAGKHEIVIDEPAAQMQPRQANSAQAGRRVEHAKISGAIADQG